KTQIDLGTHLLTNKLFNDIPLELIQSLEITDFQNTRFLASQRGGCHLKSAKSVMLTSRRAVYFEVKDAAEIKLLAKNMVFIRGAWRNDCDCRGYPGMDWYVGDKLVAITAIKHGYGIIRNRTIARFTKESKIWMTKWLLEHGIKKEQLR
ncbi:MAG: hypothetical protein P1U90_04330, partial [Akkermansiaceae bacterium]|nr:hypothetical protein [Akkermansiaceae bacterium]